MRRDQSRVSRLRERKQRRERDQRVCASAQRDLFVKTSSSAPGEVGDEPAEGSARVGARGMRVHDSQEGLYATLRLCAGAARGDGHADVATSSEPWLEPATRPACVRPSSSLSTAGGERACARRGSRVCGQAVWGG